MSQDEKYKREIKQYLKNADYKFNRSLTSSWRRGAVYQKRVERKVNGTLVRGTTTVILGDGYHLHMSFDDGLEFSKGYHDYAKWQDNMKEFNAFYAEYRKSPRVDSEYIRHEIVRLSFSIDEFADFFAALFYDVAGYLFSEHYGRADLEDWILGKMNPVSVDVLRTSLALRGYNRHEAQIFLADRARDEG